MSLELIMGIIFGGGGGGVFALIFRTFIGKRRRKIDDNETIILRLVSENERLQIRADREEKRADLAEAEADRFRKTIRDLRNSDGQGK